MKDFPIAYLQTDAHSAILAFGEEARCVTTPGKALENLSDFTKKHAGAYLFTALSYDLKNEIEKLSSSNVDITEFPDLICWKASNVISIHNQEITWLQGEKNEKTAQFITEFLAKKTGVLPQIKFQARISKSDYIQNIEAIREEIQLGNCYELNFCQEFYADQVPDLPSDLVRQTLFELTKAPFSAYLKYDQFEIFCGSPERFLKRTGTKLISQPIKGTIRRGKTKAEDDQLKTQLQNDPKERAENVMICDLVRNDLSRIAKKNSVLVEELFGVHTFETVHHLISTVTCEIEKECDLAQILHATFPMGSMTGAPKYKVMELCENYEAFKRGIYSGSLGYIQPNGDFDFNVVIRSLVYNRAKKTLSCAVGGAITIQSSPEKEYEECAVKVNRILNLFH